MPSSLVQFIRAHVLADERRTLELRTQMLGIIGRHGAANGTDGPRVRAVGGPADDAVARRSLEFIDNHLAVLNTMVRLADLHAGCREGCPCRVDAGEELGPLAWGYLGNDRACATLQEMARRYHGHADFDPDWLPRPPEQDEPAPEPIPLQRPAR